MYLDVFAYVSGPEKGRASSELVYDACDSSSDLAMLSVTLPFAVIGSSCSSGVRFPLCSVRHLSCHDARSRRRRDVAVFCDIELSAAEVRVFIEASFAAPAARCDASDGSVPQQPRKRTVA